MYFLLIVFTIFVLIFLALYLCTLPERRIQEELLHLQNDLVLEKLSSEMGKQNARALGKATRDKISRIASHK